MFARNCVSVWMGGRWLVPGRICKPQNGERGTEVEEKGLINSSSKVFSQQGTSKLNSQSDNYCTLQN